MNSHLKQLVILLLICFSQNMLAQEKTINGTVSGLDGPLPGASVAQKGTATGTITDAAGGFNLKLEPNAEQVLLVSFIGYNTEEISISGNQSTLTITLEPDISTLQEVVVVGYGVKKKVNLTGAVGEVKLESLEGKPVTNAYQALQGEAAGLIVQQGSSEPGTYPQINIRGLSTINGNTPLIVVDGVIGSLNNVNPNDIKSISVLKDAASAAIYGSRAASGVILVTTKSGEAGKPTLVYSTNFGIQEPTNFPDAADSWEYATLRNEALVNSGLAPQFTAEQIRGFKENGPNVFHYREIFKKYAPQSNHNLSFSGKNNGTDYFVSLGYQNQESLFKGPDYGYKRYNLRVNLSKEINKRLTLSTRIALARNDIKDHAWWTEWLIEPTVRIPTIYNALDENGDYTLVSGSNGSSLARLEKGGARTSQNDEALINLSASYKLIENLTLKALLSSNITSNRSHEFRKAITYAYPGGGDNQNSVTDSHSNSLYLNPYVTATYNKEIFSGGTIDLLAGVSSERFKNNFFGVQGIGVPGNQFGVINNTSELLYVQGPNGLENEEWAINSFFGRAGFTYKDKYLFEGNLRYDGSSRFAKDIRWGLFPSLSAGWVISNEDFFEPVKPIISMAKIRGSWGKLGNQDINDLYGYQSLVSVSSNIYAFGNVSVPGTFYSVSNANRSWETTTMKNLGIDLSFFNNRFTLSAELFDNLTNDILLQLPVPETYGLGQPYQNAGSVRNRGWEVSLDYNLKTGALNNIFSLNFSDNSNEVVDLKGKEFISGSDVHNILREGYPLYSYYALKSDGFFNSQEEVSASAKPIFATSVKPGDIKYTDRNRDGQIDYENDRFVLGNPFPRYTFGFTYRVNWKGLDFSFLLQGVAKRSQWVRGEIVEAFHNNNEGPVFNRHLDRWTPFNTDASYPRLTVGSESVNNAARSDFWIQDAKYLRVKNVQIGYSLPQTLVNRVGISDLRIYLTGLNLLTFSPMNIGLDPEVTSNLNGGGSANNGRVYPVSRVFSMGLDVKF